MYIDSHIYFDIIHITRRGTNGGAAISTYIYHLYIWT